MHLSPLITPQGEPTFISGGASAWKTYQYRDFIVSLEWLEKGGAKLPEPCMVVLPATRINTKGMEQTGGWAIGRRAMLDFLDFDANGKATGRPTFHAVREAVQALPVLGKDTYDKSALHTLLDIVTTHGPEVARVPVKRTPTFKAEPVWELTAINKATGQVIRESEV